MEERNKYNKRNTVFTRQFLLQTHKMSVDIIKFVVAVQNCFVKHGVCSIIVFFK